MPENFTNPAALAEAVVRRVGKRVVLGLPLGLGKATHLANALYALAEADRSIELNIFTALTLEAPTPKSDLETRFFGPIYDRAFGGYPKLAYAQAQKRGALPANIEVNEFFFQAGTRLNSPSAQQSYIAANYTHACRYLIGRGINVIGQLVAAKRQGGERRFSLSCNSDTTLDLLPFRARGERDFLLVGQVNDELPFMGGDADLPAETFDLILDGCDFPLFAPPKEPVAEVHYAIGFHVASLVPDGGTLQLGIGATADAICQALIVREKAPDVFAATVERLVGERPQTIRRHTGRFEEGLYACTEMVVDGFLELYGAGVLKREAEGVVLHGGFFLGPRSFYRRLREMPEAERAKFAMKAISFTNALYGDQERKARERCGARFANNAMMATLMGAAISDGFEDGRVLSGVGGQFNFVEQAFGLWQAGVDARSILTLNAARDAGRARSSNIRWSYGHGTVPRHMKDVIVSEYGVADLRGRTDEATIVEMLGLAEAPFQEGLLVKARVAGKVAKSFRLPAAYARNTPGALQEALSPARAAGLLPPFPFGTDLTALEQKLGARLVKAQAAATHPAALAAMIARGMGAKPDAETDAMLHRLQLEHSEGLEQTVSAALVRGAA